MPSAYAHTRFGADVLPLLPVGLHARVDSYRSLFELGLHGPDIFRFSAALRQLDADLHRETGLAVFRRFAALDDGSGAAFAYLAGFLCHFALDSLCCAYLAETEAMGMRRALLETQLDRALLLQDGKDPLREDLMANLRIKPQNIRVISRFFPQLTETQVERALLDMRRRHTLLLAKGAPKRFLLSTALRIANYQDTVGARIMQDHEVAVCRPMVKNLQALYQEAIPVAVRLISAYPALEDAHFSLPFEQKQKT